MKKIIRITLIVLLIILIGIQFIRPKKNLSNTMSANDISITYPIPAHVDSILKTSCHDCHSNNSYYPWYWNFQPVAWFMNGHIEEGKKHLNFSDFTTYPIFKQYGKFKQINDEVKSGDMPLSSYTLIHRDARLSAQDQHKLEDWVSSSRKQLEANYPPDSLVKKKK
ncbi:MAG: heme-binding domain-containing protein [Bacteroidota bacterium]|nr:heme-binding domain-containing protein [Bacteroidota bacterium]